MWYHCLLSLCSSIKAKTTEPMFIKVCTKMAFYVYPVLFTVILLIPKDIEIYILQIHSSIGGRGGGEHF